MLEYLLEAEVNILFKPIQLLTDKYKAHTVITAVGEGYMCIFKR